MWIVLGFRMSEKSGQTGCFVIIIRFYMFFMNGINTLIKYNHKYYDIVVNDKYFIQ